jgi:hypothetical protein
MKTLRIGIAIGLVSVFALSGCSNRSGSASRILGSITYKGQTLKAGAVFLVFDKGGEYHTGIRSDGTFQFIDVPTGQAKVLVDTETFNPEGKPQSYVKSMKGKQIAKGYNKSFDEYNAMMGHGGNAGGGKGADATDSLTKEQKAELAKVYVKIPGKYGSEKTSPLYYEVESGSQTVTWELVD